MEKLVFYCGRGNYHIASDTLTQLREYLRRNCKFSTIAFAEFPDEESDVRLPNYQGIKGKTVVFFQTIHKKEHLEEALELIWAMKKQYGAIWIILVVPFLMFRRQDHDERLDEIWRLKMAIDRLHHAGVDEIITVYPHSPKMRQYCDEYGIIMHEVEPAPLFVSTVQTYLRDDDKPAVYSPDEGSIIRAVSLAKLLNCEVIFNLKNRGFDNQAVIREEDAAEVQKIVNSWITKTGYANIHYADQEHIVDRSIIATEDEFNTCGTISTTAARLKNFGAKHLIVMAMHAALVRGWQRKLFKTGKGGAPNIDIVIMGNTIYREIENRTGGAVHDIFVSELLAQRLYRVIEGHKLNT